MMRSRDLDDMTVSMIAAMMCISNGGETAMDNSLMLQEQRREEPVASSR